METSSLKTRGANYKTHEDVVLCKAWLSVSYDPIVGIYQTGDDFYRKVKAEFDDELARQSNAVAERSSASLQSRFQTISHAVSKFVGCHEKVSAAITSGRSPVDIEHDAIRLYEASPKNGTFKFTQCWYVLRDSPKWGAWRSSNAKRKTPKATNKRSFSQVDDDESESPSSSLSDTPQATIVQPTPAVQDKKTVGAGRAKMERANLALYARQVKAAERSVAVTGLHSL